MKIVLAGQPNSGKSTLFNAVAGYRSISANFPGSTIHYTCSQTRVNGVRMEIVDLPGTYSLASTNPAETAARQYLLEEEVDAVVNVVDASLLARSLELTLQLLELQIPLVVCLNMMDDATRKGIDIDVARFSDLLKVPVATTVARKGTGVNELFRVASAVASRKQLPGAVLHGHRDVEQVFNELGARISVEMSELYPFSRRLLAIKLLEGEEWLLRQASGPEMEAVEECRRRLEESHGRPADVVIESERHALAMELAEKVSTVSKPHRNWRDAVDEALMHPIWGYVLLAVILYLFFVGVFRSGALLETEMLRWFDSLDKGIRAYFAGSPFWSTVAGGMIQGFAGGAAIVLPYLTPFLLGLAILEDVGYLPRVAFLMDAFMHRIGLHGTAVLPAMLGYGCSVPAVMATRILSSRRDRIIASIISILVPCSARTTVILGLVGFYLGPSWAFAMYAINIAVVVAAGRILCRLMPQLTPGMLLEVPRYQLPTLRSLFFKTWYRLREFVEIAWPLLIVGSVILALAQYYGVTEVINEALSPLTVGLLGLPVVTGMTLIFGVLRKELSLLMLIQALGTAEIASVMSSQQIVTFTIFVMFYVPCVATIGILMKETGTRVTAYATIATLALAVAAGVFTRLAFGLF